MSDYVEAGEQERTFDCYHNLSWEMRSHIIDRMQTEERCIFAATSKLNCREVKSSPNYLFKLALKGDERNIVIRVQHSKIQSEGFKMEFYNLPWYKAMSYSPKATQLDRFRPHIPLTHSTNYDESVDLFYYSVEHFKKLLKFYQRTVKSLDIKGSVFRRSLDNFGFVIDNFRNLEELAIDTVYMEHLLPKIRQNLKKLEIRGRTSNEILANYEQIYQVEENLKLTCINLNNEQFVRIAATTATLHIGELTVENLYNFIRGWQNGTLQKAVVRYEWKEAERIDRNELFRLLGGAESENKTMELVHFVEAGKSAQLTYKRETLVFCINE